MKTLKRLISVSLLLPIVVVLLAWLTPNMDLWSHLWQTLLPQIISNSVLLLMGVAIGVAILGTLLAWLVVMVDFPGSRYLEMALFLPLAMPAYVLAFVYLAIFDYAGALQSSLRDSGFDFIAFDIRNHPVTMVLMFVIVFYPYVYMFTRASFRRHKRSFIEAAKLLGCQPLALFFRLSLPLVRPAMIAGVALALMETLSDFGVVSLFNYNIFTTAIYSAWQDYRAIEVGAQIASVLMIVAILLIQLERYGRGNSRYYGDAVLTEKPYQLSGYRGWLLSFFVGGVVVLAVIVPVGQLLIWLYQDWQQIHFDNYFNLTINSLILMSVTALLTLIVALLLVLPQSFDKTEKTSWLNSLSTLGYALPGSVIAVGLLYGVNLLSGLTTLFGMGSLNTLLFGSIFLLLFTYVCRFIALAFHPIEAALGQIKPSLIEAARLLNVSKARIIYRIQLPIIKPSLLAAMLLILIDVMKELPATYLLRPLGWDTLAIKTFELSHEGLYQAAALPALIMVIIVMFLTVLLRRVDPH